MDGSIMDQIATKVSEEIRIRSQAVLRGTYLHEERYDASADEVFVIVRYEPNLRLLGARD
jgi:hypothetical protein